MRAIIDLPDQQLDQLRAVCAREGISRAEAVRRAVEGYLKRATTVAPPDAAFGLWRDKPLPAATGAAQGQPSDPSLSYQQALRSEWER